MACKQPTNLTPDLTPVKALMYIRPEAIYLQSSIMHLRLLLFSFLCAFAPWAELPAQSAYASHIGVKDGLPHAGITCLLQDSRGFIWAGTRNGLARYDAYSFSVLQHVVGDSSSLSSNSITALCEDDQGYIWVGTHFGLNRLNPKTLKCRRYYSWHGDTSSLSSNKVTSLASDPSGSIWIGTENGLNRSADFGARFERHSIRHEDPQSLSSNFIHNLHIDRSGQLWVGTEIGLNRYEGQGRFRRFKHGYEDEQSLSDNQILALCEDVEGRLWVGTRNGLNIMTPGSDIFHRFFAERQNGKLLSSNVIAALRGDGSGHVWVGTPKGLDILAVDGSENPPIRRGYNTMIDKPVSPVTSLLIDRSGLLWLGTQSAGLLTFSDRVQRFHTYAPGENGRGQDYSKVYCFDRKGGELLTGTGRGVMRFSAKSAKASEDYLHWEAGEMLVDIGVAVRDMMCMEDHILWLATDGMGLLQIDTKSGEILRKHTVQPDSLGSISSNRISCLAEADSGRIWIGTSGGGFAKFDPHQEAFKTYRYSAAGSVALRDNNITKILPQGDSLLWIGTGNGGFYCLHLSTDSLELIGSDLDAEHALRRGINDLHLDVDLSLWVATPSGLYTYRSGEVEHDFRLQSDPASRVILALLASAGQDNLWMSTYGGIAAYDVRSSGLQQFTEEEIPGFNTYFLGSAYVDEDDYMYFGGVNGFTYFRSDGLRENTYIPPISICKVRSLVDREGGKDAATPLSSDSVVFAHNHPGFTVEFTALNFHQAERNQYAYRLLGLSDEWRFMGNRRFATFSSLGPGSYVLEVRGSNNDGLWNVDEPARLHIIVRHALWQKAWFQTLLLLLLMGVLYLAYLYRIRKEKQRREYLEDTVKERTGEIARERDTNAMLIKEIHHRVKNNLQIIVSLLSLQSRYIADRNLLGIFTEVQNRVRSMSLIHEKMYKSRDLSNVNLAEYIEDLSKNLIDTYQLEQRISLDVQVGANKFHSDTLTPLGLIINEVISNALKHAFPEGAEGRIYVQIDHLSGLRYRMLIGDDGVGAPAEHLLPKGESLGRELIMALTEQLNGTIKRADVLKGTAFEIEFEDIDEVS